MTQKTSSSFTVCHNFALEINYFPVLLSVRALLARLPKRNKRKVVSGSRVTLPENFACKPGLSFNPLARVTLAVGLPYLLVNRALICNKYIHWIAIYPVHSVIHFRTGASRLDGMFTLHTGLHKLSGVEETGS